MTELNDIFGIKPYGESLKIIVEKSADGAGKFLTAVCLPAAEEFGLMLKDKFRYWRLKNIIRMLEKSQSRFEFDSNELQLKVNPRIGVEIIENASWQDDELILDMWSGLLNSSLTIDTKDDSNLVFVNLLKSITTVQAKLLNHICQIGNILYDKNGLIYSESHCEIMIEKLYKITNCLDINRLDREIDDLRAKALLPSSSFLSSEGTGFSVNQEDFSKVTLRPTPLALHLYARVNGFKEINDCFKNNNSC